jgi:hypothetical protein
MRSIALPIRITRDGQLDRGEDTDQVLRLIQAMAATTSGQWPHAPWFGLHEQFVGANMALQEQPLLTDAINTALANLGVDWARVRRIGTAGGRSGFGDRSFEITLLVDGERTVYGTVTS